MTTLPRFLIEQINDDLLKVASENQLELIKKQCALLPDFNKLAIEFKLDSSKGVDFHLNLRRSDNIHTIIRQLQKTAMKQEEKWQPLISLIEKWIDEDSLMSKHVEGMYLEYDSSVKNNEVELPSVFFKVTAKYNKQEAHLLTKDIIYQLKGETFYFANQAIIEQCVFNAPGKSYLGYLGLMLSRPIEVLRINLYKMLPEEVIPFLQKSGWKGNAILVENKFKLLSAICDAVVLSFDVYQNKILPKIGMEAFLDHLPYRDPRWEHLLSIYEEQHLCTENKKNIVLKWNKTFFPFDVPKWHSSLVMNSLDKNQREFSILKQLTFHTKLSIENEDVVAKSYLGFGQTWISNPLITNFDRTGNTLSSAIDVATQYLLSQQQQSGYWRDYLLPPGTSDQWVSAYIGNVLVKINNPKAQNAAKNAWEILKESERPNGWGYSFLTPPDADSTVWSLLLAQHFEDDEWMHLKSKKLLPYLNEKGGIQTYFDKKSIKENAQLNSNALVTGWTAEHQCVSAVVANILSERVLPFLHEIQSEDGSWKSYWWTSDIYATSMAVKAFHNAKKEIPQKEKVQQWLKKQEEHFINTIEKKAYPNCFHIALLADALKILSAANNCNTLINYLLSQQNNEGFWKGCSELKVPQPEVINTQNKKDFFVVNDINNLFTTATILHTLINYGSEKI